MTIQANLITSIRDGGGFCRTVAGIITFSVLWLSVYPTLLLAQESPISQSPGVGYVDDSGANALNDLLVTLESTFHDLALSPDNEELVEEVWRAVEKIESDIRELDTEILDEFSATAMVIGDRDVDDVIKDRYNVALTNYRTQMSTLFDDINEIRTEKNAKERAKEAAALANRLGSLKKGRNQQKFDPDELPTRSADSALQVPAKTSKLQFILDDPIGDGRSLVASIDGIVPSGEDAFTNPDWLSESDEVAFTQSIVDLALQLENDPVKIYHWVRNNVQWESGWGARQSADLTLQLKSGNAMDIASLTIALLRTSSVPARYVHGTIEMDEAQFRNWVGGFESISGALEFASNTGLPVTTVTGAGRIAKVQVEHIWLEAAVDFFPSRGATNRTPDTWLPLDPSAKQYEVTAGINLLAESSIDSAQLVQDFSQSGTVSEAEGWLSGYDTSAFLSSSEVGRQEIATFIEDQLGNPLVRDVIGGKRVIIQDFPSLASQLPYPVVVVGARFSSIPQSLQQTIEYSLVNSGAFNAGSPFVQFPWSEVNNRKVSLSFTPATPADEAALLAFFPDGQLNDISQIPDSFPAYLIEVLPELRLNGAIVLTGEPLTLGEEVTLQYSVDHASLRRFGFSHSVIAGSYLTAAAIGSHVSEVSTSKVGDRLADTRVILESQEVAALSQLTRDELVGDIFYAGMLGYYSQYIAFATLAGSQQHGHHDLTAGVGIFGYEPKVSLLFGIPRSISAGGAVLDIPMIRGIAIDTPANNITRLVTTTRPQFGLALGLMASALEYLVPEQMFLNTIPGAEEAVSTVKVFRIATASGQRLYELSQSNLSALDSAINLDPVTEDEIRQSIMTGKTVITHTDPLSAGGWTGAGYVIFDQATGDGAYKISGGLNGGLEMLGDFTKIIGVAAITTVSIFVGFALFGLLIGILIALFELMLYFSFVNSIGEAETITDFNGQVAGSAFLAVLPLLFVSANPAVVSVAVFAWVLMGLISMVFPP